MITFFDEMKGKKRSIDGNEEEMKNGVLRSMRDMVEVEEEVRKVFLVMELKYKQWIDRKREKKIQKVNM